jgi:hypothetical protein
MSASKRFLLSDTDDLSARTSSAGWTARIPSALKERFDLHNAFWRGEGPGLILIPVGDVPLYDTAGYAARFYEPAKMWEAEIARARSVIDWPTDGIPTVRPNLGTIFVPALAGQEYLVQDGQMPWVRGALSREEIAQARGATLAQAQVMQLAESFYRIHHASGEKGIIAYHPDVQGAFDIAHLLYGDGIFLDMMDPGAEAWMDELLEISLDLMVRATRHIKRLLGEPDAAMVHGHATPQGVYFPHAGIRISEDTATLVSPASIERFVLPMIERAAIPFGGAFLHYCGRHPAFFEMLCRMPCVRAIDLGNPEMYDTRRLMEQCAATGTVLYSRLAAEPGEDWRDYTQCLGALVRETGVRCILRPLVYPSSWEECLEMKELWHDCTVQSAR